MCLNRSSAYNLPEAPVMKVMQNRIRYRYSAIVVARHLFVKLVGAKTAHDALNRLSEYLMIPIMRYQ